MALSDLMPGAYSVTVSDAHDCVSSGSFTILPGGCLFWPLR